MEPMWWEWIPWLSRKFIERFHFNWIRHSDRESQFLKPQFRRVHFIFACQWIRIGIFVRQWIESDIHCSAMQENSISSGLFPLMFPCTVGGVGEKAAIRLGIHLNKRTLFIPCFTSFCSRRVPTTNDTALWNLPPPTHSPVASLFCLPLTLLTITLPKNHRSTSCCSTRSTHSSRMMYTFISATFPSRSSPYLFRFVSRCPHFVALSFN